MGYAEGREWKEMGIIRESLMEKLVFMKYSKIKR